MKQRQLNSQQRRKRKAEIVSVSVLSKVLSLDLLSCPQIWNLEKEKAGDRPAKLDEKKSDRELERDTTKKGNIFCWINNMKVL